MSESCEAVHILVPNGGLPTLSWPRANMHARILSTPGATGTQGWTLSPEVKYDSDVADASQHRAQCCPMQPGVPCYDGFFWRGTQALHSRLKVHSLASSSDLEIHGVDTVPIMAPVRFLPYFQLRKWLRGRSV